MLYLPLADQLPIRHHSEACTLHPCSPTPATMDPTTTPLYYTTRPAAETPAADFSIPSTLLFHIHDHDACTPPPHPPRVTTTDPVTRALSPIPACWIDGSGERRSPTCMSPPKSSDGAPLGKWTVEEETAAMLLRLHGPG